MSFITKRERVFHELELFDLPARNEGKLKAYGSCTDARAWSHFGASKAEHLTELIKRNNDLSTPAKYVPTTVIVDTLMVSKNLEIGRLKRKIEEFEQLLAVYEELDLDCAQKCEIAKAHAAIKAANKDLDDLCLNLDTSTFTDGFETESFETGKSRSVPYSANASIRSRGGESDRSRGDAWTVMSHDKDLRTQANQTSLVCPCDAAVSVEDPRIDEMRDQIISKDAKLNAMHNTMAIMENDLCEPFGIYAHIYTALEKIYGILSQNSKYKNYLNLMTAGKDIRCIDIKGKILYKMKVLEKFCLALIAPCSKEFSCSNANDCPCYRVDVSSNIEFAYRITPAESASSESTKRSQLVADIMQHEEMKEILSKESTPDDFEIDKVLDTASTINEDNQKRIKDLQECYEDLLNCYENLKHETDCIRLRCARYEELELEIERLHGQLKEYNSLWNEKEHYRKRSEDLDSLKQQYMVLAEESSGLETKLKAESEINHIKADAIEELRNQNITLEKRLNDLYISFEKDKNNLQCQLQESECKCMCQEQQIKSLSTQIVKLLEQEPENIPREDTAHNLFLTEENETLKEQLKHYQNIEHEFHNKMSLIKELESEITQWRAAYEETAEHNRYLEHCIDSHKEEKERLINDNLALLDRIKDKSAAVENLMDIIKTKSIEINKLTDENQNYNSQLELLGEKYEKQVNLSRQESQELFQKVKDYDDFVQKQEDLSNVIEKKMLEYESLKELLKQKLEENQKLKDNLNLLQDADTQNKKSIDIVKKESLIMQRKISELEDIGQQFTELKDAFEKLSAEKNGLEVELKKKASQLESAIYSVKLNRKESGELLKHSESIKDELTKLNLDNQKYISKNGELQRELNILQQENQTLKNKSAMLVMLEQELSDLKKAINKLLDDKAQLEHALEIKNQEMSNLCNALETKIEENRSLNNKLETLQSDHMKATNHIRNLENENELNQISLDTCKKESSAVMEKLQYCHKTLVDEYNDLKTDHETVKLEKERLQKELEAQLLNLEIVQQEKQGLEGRTDDLLAHNHDLEKALVTTRNELLSRQSSHSENIPYATLREEIQKMKIEKVEGQNKIRELLDRLDESEQIIANFNDEVQARDHKIAVMQNQINNLEDEVRRLQDLLETAIDAGNDFKNTSHSIEEARKQIEAHHSKASHNMKLELALLHKSKSQLEDQLSITKSQNELSSKDKQKYLSEIYDLKNDREIIVADINQLEIYSVGDSELTPDNCELDHVLNSLHRIKQAFGVKMSKNTSLEQTLAKVQASSQLFLNKADDAKKYFDNERQKIITEKEDALREKINMEKQLNDMKKELDRQISRDGDIITNLEAEICNHKLIIDKINDSTKTYIMKLENEMQSLQDLYQNSLTKIRELQEKLDSNTADKDRKEDIIQNLITDLEKKSKEVAELQSIVAHKNSDKFANKAVQIQKPSSNYYRDMTSQTDDVQMHTFFDHSEPHKSTDRVHGLEMLKSNKSQTRDYIKPVYELLPQQKSPPVNEVQILAASVEPTFDFVRSSYLNYKIKRLSPGLLEHHSISSLIEDMHSKNQVFSNISYNSPCSADSDPNKLLIVKSQSSDDDLIDIYHGPSDDTHISSKMLDINSQKPKPHSENISESVNTKVKSNILVGNEGEPIINQSSSQTSLSNTDIFVIIKDNKNSYEIMPHAQNLISSVEQQLSSVPNVDKDRKLPKSLVKNGAGKTQLPKKQKTDGLKRKLNINLPRVGVDSHSFTTTADYDDNSLDSYTVDIYSHPVKETISDTTVMIPTSGEDMVKYETPSLPTISNVDDIYLETRSFIKAPSKESSLTKNSNQTELKTSSDIPIESKDDFFEGENHVVKFIRKQPQKLSSLIDKLDQSRSKVNDSNSHLVPGNTRKTRASRVSQRDLSQDSLSKSDNSRDPFVVTAKRGVVTKTPQQAIGIRDKTDDYSRDCSSDINKTRASLISQHIFTEDSDNYSDDNNDYFVINDKNSEKTDKKPYRNLGDVPDSEKSYDRKGFFEANGKSIAKTKLTQGNVDQGNGNNINSSDRLASNRNGKISPDNYDQDNDYNSDSSVGQFISDGKSGSKMSHHDLARVGADVFSKVFKSSIDLPDDENKNNNRRKLNDAGFKYILDSVNPNRENLSIDNLITIQSENRYVNTDNQSWITLSKRESINKSNKNVPKSIDQSVMVKLDSSSKYYEDIIDNLKKSLEYVEKDHKMQIESIKIQYDRNVNSIINEHNQGVKNIQNLHEETLQDIMRVHENEVENLRSMSIEAMRKAEKLEIEYMALKYKMNVDNSSLLDEVPTKCVASLDIKKPKNKLPSDTKVLTKTTIESFNVKPKQRLLGPCTCSINLDISDTIRNIFEQVDAEQRKMAETTYLKYIATKISNGQIEALDSQELSFLHLKVCRAWKQKLHKEEALQKKIDSLEVALINKQRSAQQHMAELDRKVAQEKRRLEEVREAVCRSVPVDVTEESPTAAQARAATIDNNRSCACNIVYHEPTERRSAGDLVVAGPTGATRTKKKTEPKGVLMRADGEERRDRRMYSDEPPTRLRRQHDRFPPRLAKK